jgi:multisubunit Na+/H+ antiporter MnhB subunit
MAERGPHWPALLLVLAALAGLGAALLELPADVPGLKTLVAERMPVGAKGNAVTMVLLDFRGYDTLLEIGVLLLAVTVVRSLGPVPVGRGGETTPVLTGFVGVVGPLMLVIAGYLFWVGSDAPGGEFQAGAVLGALGVLLLAARRPTGRVPDAPLRLVLSAGLLVFLAVAVAVMLPGGHFLEYPRPYAKALMLLVEVAAIFSIGAVLVSLYAGGHPGPDDEESEESRR